MYSIVAKKPSDCSAQELKLFAELVMVGGEVANSLPARIQKAASLVMLFNGDELVGTAGLKRPEADYQNKVFFKAQAERASMDFSFELGWVYIDSEHRGSKKAMALIQAAMNSSEGALVFATARDNNEAMHHLLKMAGFAPSGGSYPSQQNADRRLCCS